MRLSRNVPLLAVAVLVPLAGCFNPPLDGVTLTCTSEDPRCPDGQSCQNGICRAEPRDLAASADGMAATDGAPPDQARPGCSKGGGVQVGGAWACAGTFAKGGAATLCAVGFAPCKSPANIDLAACNQLPGFFVADVLAFSQFPECHNVDPPLFRCGSYQAGFDNRLRYGCGGLAKPYVLTSCQRQCAGFDRALNCSREVDYICGASMSLADEANILPAIGTLCCPG